MNRDRIICGESGAEFNGTDAEAVAAGWRFSRNGWEAPAEGWSRQPRRLIETEFVAYDNGVDFA